ncbi:MAG: aminotransferase class V-fold PLP-dependent enzyme [Nitrospinota bacterium]|nr:aminotransferase class V-fold PLP-dependent enzyme [Nitrospinota bacterium]
MSQFRRVYLDNNATTPMRAEALEAMLPYMKDNFGNPSSAHGFGRPIKARIAEAREIIAAGIGASPQEIIFTGGGTEADNLAIKGCAWAHRSDDRRRIVTSVVEHPAVLEVVRYLVKRQGFIATHVKVNGQALVDPAEVEQACGEDTLMASFMLANNEVGAIQPVAKIAEGVKKHGAFLHTDAVQAFCKIPVNVDELGVDMMSLSSHKINGPKGVGALYVRKGTKIDATNHGGHHERSMRAGTENVAGIIGFAKAAELGLAEMGKNSIHLAAMRDELQRRIMSQIPFARLNGPEKERLPNTVNISFECVEGEALLINLDMVGIAISTGSACSSGSLEPSHVLMAMGIPTEVVHGSLRFSFGHFNTMEDVDYVMTHLPRIINTVREISPLWDLQNQKVITVDEAAKGAHYAGH